MRVIAGLGNPEKNYKGTRHNVGFETINKLAYDHNIDINKAKHRAHSGKGSVEGEKTLLVKPQTYMNRSGECIRDILGYFDLPPSDLIVVYDDIDLEPGQIRVRERGSGGSHNGMKNIIYHLETDEILRVRIGIGKKPDGWNLADYVLSAIRPREMDSIIEGVIKAAEAVELILRESPACAMNRFNIRERKTT